MNISLREMAKAVGMNHQILMGLKQKGIYDLKPVFLHGSIISPEAQAIVLTWIYKASKKLFKRGTKKSIALVKALKEGIQNHEPGKEIMLRFAYMEDFDCVAYYEPIEDMGLWTMEQFSMTPEDERMAKETEKTFSRFDTWILGVTRFLFHIQAILLKSQDIKEAIQEVERTLRKAA